MSVVRPSIVAALLVCLAPLSGLADERGRPDAGAAGQPVPPAITGTYFMQQTPVTGCQKLGTSPDYWTCSGFGSVLSGAKGLLVTHFNCQVYFGGAATKVEVDIGRGTSINTLTDTMAYPSAQTFVQGTTRFHATDVTLEYVVPTGNGVGFSAYIIGTSITAPHMSCTYTGRLVTM